MGKWIAAAVGTVLLAGCGGSGPDNQQDASEIPNRPETSSSESAAPAGSARPGSFAMCLTCHSAGQGEPAKIGPNLFGVYGAEAGSRPGYEYSDAMKNAGFTWTPDKLDAYLAAPMKVVPGTKMAFAGLPDPGARRKVIDYLATLK